MLCSDNLLAHPCFAISGCRSFEETQNSKRDDDDEDNKKDTQKRQAMQPNITTTQSDTTNSATQQQVSVSESIMALYAGMLKINLYF